MTVDLPEPVCADEEHELAALDGERRLVEADVAALVDLGDAAELDDVPAAGAGGGGRLGAPAWRPRRAAAARAVLGVGGHAVAERSEP